MENPTIAIACGSCLDIVAASHVPTFCRGCRARFDRDAPHAVVSLRLEAHAGGIRVATDTTFRGAWDEGLLAHVREALEGVEAGRTRRHDR